MTSLSTVLDLLKGGNEEPNSLLAILALPKFTETVSERIRREISEIRCSTANPKSIFGVVSLNATPNGRTISTRRALFGEISFQTKKKEKRICNEITQCGAEPAKTAAVYFLIYFVIKYLRNSLYQEITEIRYITLSKSIL